MAVEVLELMCREAVELSAIHCNAAIASSGRLAAWQDALRCLELMESRELQRDLYSYSSSLSSCAKDRGPRRA